MDELAIGLGDEHLDGGLRFPVSSGSVSWSMERRSSPAAWEYHWCAAKNFLTSRAHGPPEVSIELSLINLTFRYAESSEKY